MSSTCCFCRILDIPAALVRHLFERHVLGAHASQHVKTVMYPFSMISPPKIAETGTPRLSAMGGRAGFDPSSPLGPRLESRWPVRDFKKFPHFCPPPVAVIEGSSLAVPGGIGGSSEKPSSTKDDFS